MRNFGILPDRSNSLRYPDHVTGVQLSTEAQAVAVPSSLGAIQALFSAEVNFAVAYSTGSGTSVASFTTGASTGSELNPAVRSWPKGGLTELSIIGRSSGFLSIAWFNNGST